jgi:hypothetical protein
MHVNIYLQNQLSKNMYDVDASFLGRKVRILFPN